MEKQIQVEENEYCKVMVTYIAEPEKVISKRAEVTDDVFKQVSKVVIPGYRKGKAPMQAVKMRYRKQIEDQLKQEMVSMAEQDIMFETKMKTLFYPQVLSAELNDSRFECQMLFLKKPEFELKQYKGFEIPKPHLPKTHPELVEHMLEELRVKYGDVVPFQENDFVQMNDKVTMDVKCVVGEKVQENLTKEGMFYSVGSVFYNGFDENIQGMAAGEERTFDLVWDSATNERVIFTVKIHMGVKAVPAALDDSFAQKLGLETFNKLRAEVEGAAGKKITEFEAKAVNDQIVARLMSEHDFEIPGWLVSMDAQQLAAQHGLKWTEIDQDSIKVLEDKAKNRVKLSLIMDSIRDAEADIQLNESEMINIIKNRVTEQGQDPDKFLVEMQRTGKLFGLVAGLQQEATMEWLTKQSTIIE